jgi:ubiquinone/menaquinone biosynthesis C-methylase UbiE
MNTLLPASEYYAYFPIFKLDLRGVLLESNPATDILFHTPSPMEENSIPVTPMMQSIFGEGGLIIGKIQETGQAEACVETMNAGVRSRQFGDVGLRLTIVKLPNPQVEDSFLVTVYAEIVDISNIQSYFDKLRQELQQNLLWETYAMSYDIVLPQLDFYEEVVNRHVCALTRGGLQRVIDIGAGTGSVTAPLLSVGCHVTAIDVSRAMLERLRAKLKPAELERASISQKDAKSLSFLENASFDGVNILLALFDMSDPIGALNEAIRVLRPGGVMIITEPRRTYNAYDLLASAEACLRRKGLYEQLAAHWKRVSQINRNIDPAKREMRLFVEDIEVLLSKSGLYVNNIKDSHHGNCATIWAEKRC